MDIIFFGSGAFGLPTLKRLASAEAVAGGHRIVGVVTQPDRPAGRGGGVTATPIGEWAAGNLKDVPLWKPEKIREAVVVEEIRRIAGVADVDPRDTSVPQQLDTSASVAFVVIAFGQKIPPALLRGVFAINLHGSLLPRWRGAAPINAAIVAGDGMIGNSVITLAETMDAGIILGQSRRKIEAWSGEVTAGEAHDLLSADGPDLIDEVLRQYADDDLRPVEQDAAKVTAAPKMSKGDGWVDFAAGGAEGAKECAARINGLTPWPGVTVKFRGEVLKLCRAGVAAGVAGDEAPGTIVDAKLGGVRCGGGGGVLQLLEVQPAGKRVLSWKDFANGHRVAAGEVVQGGRTTC